MAVTPLTTAHAVTSILETSLDTAVVEQFVEDASLWVNEEIVGVADLTSDRVELITRYLTAALIRLRDLGLSSVNLDDVREQYQVDPKVTDYLKRAAGFDPTGVIQDNFLPEVEGRRRGMFRVGKAYTSTRGGGR